MFVFELIPDERQRAEKRYQEFIANSTETRWSEIVFERMLERDQLEEMLAEIDSDLKRLYGLHPHQVARYGGVQSALEILRPNHPRIEQFYLHWTYYMDALLLRERTIQSLRRVIALKRFAMRIVPSFLEHYYRPPWGRGCRAAIRRLKAGI
jgi:hypothetical protein